MLSQCLEKITKNGNNLLLARLQESTKTLLSRESFFKTNKLYTKNN